MVLYVAPLGTPRRISEDWSYRAASRCVAFTQGTPLHYSLKMEAKHVDPLNLGVATLPASVSIEPPTPCAAWAFTCSSCFLNLFRVRSNPWVKSFVTSAILTLNMVSTKVFVVYALTWILWSKDIITVCRPDCVCSIFSPSSLQRPVSIGRPMPGCPPPDA
jgi:hypothetical protein